MRWAGISRGAAGAIVAAPDAFSFDETGNPIAIGRDSSGRIVKVVIALDDPGYVITVIVKGKRR
jgi:hypothetical protein